MVTCPFINSQAMVIDYGIMFTISRNRAGRDLVYAEENGLLTLAVNLFTVKRRRL